MTVRRIEPPGGPFSAGPLRVPGDKSLSHRALILAGMAEGESEVTGLGPGADVRSTRACLERIGVVFDGGRLRSPGVDGWEAPDRPLEAGNSATTLRLLAGVLAARPFRSVLVGDDSLMARPMDRLVGPLRALGARVETATGGVPPVAVGGGEGLRGAAVHVPVASAQVRSAVELAGLQAEGPTRVSSPPGFRDHTERWLEAAGRGAWVGEGMFEVRPGPVPPVSYRVPGDPSSAAFLWATAALLPGAEVTVEGVCLNPGRTGFLEILEAMGAEIEVAEDDPLQGEPVGRVRVGGKPLRSIEVGGSLSVRALDELPLVGLMGAVARGTTRIRDAAELRVKETDRIEATVALLRALGASAEPEPDGFTVRGGQGLEGGVIEARGDHRIAMAGAAAAAAADGPVEVAGAQAAEVSWPGFYDVLEALWSSP